MVLAKENRAELEKVLKYYDGKDSISRMKYDAACFLIENMPGKHTLTCTEFEKIKSEIYTLALEQNCSPYRAFELLEEKYGQLEDSKFEKIYDIDVITAEYLIKNIEFAFKVWLEAPWGEHISFERFCEEILPYRVDNEPLEDWRELFYNTFQPILESHLKIDNSVRACQYIYVELSKKNWLFDVKLLFPHLGAKTLLESRYGNCMDRCDLVVYAMRSVGIPCGIDFLMQSPEKKNPKHFWNYMTDEKDRCIAFAIEDMMPDTIRQQPHYRIGKVHRKCFASQDESYVLKLGLENIPPNFRDLYMKDVSVLYFPDERMDIPIDIADGIIYLNVFNNKDWIPIGTIPVKNKRARLEHFEPNIVYLLSRYNNEKSEKLYIPFIYNGMGIYHFLWADTTQLQTIRIDRKYPSSDRLRLFQERLLGGQFQGANGPDFNDSQLLYMIDTIPELAYQNVYINNNNKQFKYLRYLSGKNGHCDIAEIDFFDKDGKQVQKGKVIGNSVSFWNDPTIKIESVFDGDPLSYFSANDPDGAWVGLELEKPTYIGRIRYLGRNDDNGIRIGDEYELLYFSEEGWKTLGKQTALDSPLVYENVPKGALFWLRNLRRGSEERVFTYENGKQVWW
ncbi:hypothetical protein [Dysgonomonas reticulitermitis]